MKHSLLLVASTAGLLCLAAGSASADPSSSGIVWSYNFTPTLPAQPGGAVYVQADNNGGTVTFTNDTTKSASGSSDVQVTNLRESSTAPPSSPDMLTHNGAYSIALQLTDAASGVTSSALTLNGKLGGTFSATNSLVTNTILPATLGSGWTAGTNGAGQATYSWTSPGTPGNTAGNTYTVTFPPGSYAPPGPPSDSNAGAIGAHVDVVSNGNIRTASTPEPSTLVLSCLGLAFAGAASWRKRRRSLAAMLA